jgi:D-tyrosyl-tRNA(Tyr) deacylase
VADDDLAEAAARQRLLLEGLLDLVHGQEAAIDQQRTEVLPGQMGRFHQGCIVNFEPNMKAVVQRVSRASVRLGEELAGEIGAGLCVLLGVARGDSLAEASRLAGKVARLRIFEDDQGRFDRSLLDTGGEALVVSQFTLLADTAKGNRPSFTEAAPPEEAEPLYEAFSDELRQLGVQVAAGVFGARMEVELVNDGPVTIALDF